MLWNKMEDMIMKQYILSVKELYCAPAVEFMDVDTDGVICSSLEDFGRDGGSEDWFVK